MKKQAKNKTNRPELENLKTIKAEDLMQVTAGEGDTTEGRRDGTVS